MSYPATPMGVVRQRSPEAHGENRFAEPRLNRRGEGVVSDFWLQLALDGLMYGMNLGTEDAPIDITTSIDDALVWALVDVPATTTLIPQVMQLAWATESDSALINFMVEADTGKNRYSSGGSAFTSINLRSGMPASDLRRQSNCTARAGTDVTASAKTAASA